LYVTTAPTPKKPNASAFIQRRLEQIEKQKETQGLEYDVLYPAVEYSPFLKFILRTFKNYNVFDTYPHKYELNNIVYRYITKKMGLIDFLQNYYRSYEWFEKIIPDEVDLSSYDLIHAHFAFPNGIIAKNLHLKYGIPYVLTLHGTDIHTLPYKSEQLKKEIVESLENASCCIFVSDFLRKEAVNLGYSGKNAVVIPNGFDPEVFYYEKKDSAKEKMGFKEKYLVGYVGNLIDVKNVMLLPKIFNQIQEQNHNTNFVIIGEGNLDEPLKKSCFEERVDVRFTGSIPQNEVADYMRAMDIMILPSKNEGFGAVVVEAQACGVYVIGSNVGGIPEAVGSVGRVFSVNDEFLSNVSDYSVGILNNGIDIEAMLKRIKNFTWEKIIKDEFELYKL